MPFRFGPVNSFNDELSLEVSVNSVCDNWSEFRFGSTASEELRVESVIAAEEASVLAGRLIDSAKLAT